MEKVLVSLYIPSVGYYYDVRIPLFLKVKDVTRLLTDAVQKLSAGKYYPSGDELLCKKEGNTLLKKDCLMQDYGIKNGEELILI